MTLLILGLVLFIGIHAIPSFAELRLSLVGRLGEGPYKGIFSLIALGGLALIVIGKGQTEMIPLWEPPSWAELRRSR